MALIFLNFMPISVLSTPLTSFRFDCFQSGGSSFFNTLAAESINVLHLFNSWIFLQILNLRSQIFSILSVISCKSFSFFLTLQIKQLITWLLTRYSRATSFCISFSTITLQIISVFSLIPSIGRFLLRFRFPIGTSSPC